jgi:predicted DNA-binding ribbon-helix-helix protein
MPPILARSRGCIQAVSSPPPDPAKLAKRCGAADRSAMQGSAIVKRSVRIAGHATSISLESAFWQGLCDIAAARRMSVNALVAAIDAQRSGNLSSAIRLFVLDRARCGELTDGGAGAGFGASG